MCRNLPPVETAVFNKNFVGARTRHDHARKINPGYVALQALSIAHRKQVLTFQPNAERDQEFEVRMVPGQRKYAVVPKLLQTLRSVDPDTVRANLGHCTGKIRSDLAVLDAILDVRQNPVL